MDHHAEGERPYKTPHYFETGGHQSGKRETSALYAAATLTTFVVAGILAYTWWNAIDNWFTQRYPDGTDTRPRFVEATIMTVIALVLIYFVLKIKKL